MIILHYQIIDLLKIREIALYLRHFLLTSPLLWICLSCLKTDSLSVTYNNDKQAEILLLLSYDQVLSYMNSIYLFISQFQGNNTLEIIVFRMCTLV